MKVVTAREMARIEKLAISEGACGDTFMQQASKGLATFIQNYIEFYDLEPQITLIVGKGNNGGDAYCTALQLKGYSCHAYHLGELSESSELCEKYGKAFKKAGHHLIEVKDHKEVILPTSGIILDGVLGTGFEGELPALFEKVFALINQASIPVLSIDIPSGVSGDYGEMSKNAIFADDTLTLGLPKEGLFHHGGWDHVGHIEVIDFGIEEKYVKQAISEYELLEDHVCDWIPKIKNSRHKYQAGFVGGIAGCSGMMGAAQLSGLAALRSGCGIVKLAHLCQKEPLPAYPFELIHRFMDPQRVDEALSFFEKAQSIFLGPGMGLEKEKADFLKIFFKKVSVPLVIDADALSLIAKHQIPIPKG